MPPSEAAANMNPPTDGVESFKERVFDTTEVLEQILSYLSPKELLISQRTCKAFRGCYLGSRTLQLKTFVRVKQKKPENSPMGPLRRDLLKPAMLLNPLLFSSTSKWSRGYPGRYWIQTFCPVGVERSELVFQQGHTPELKLKLTPRCNDGACKLCKPDLGSWTDEYLSDPAWPTNVNISCILSREEDDGRVTATKRMRAKFSAGVKKAGWIFGFSRIVDSIMVKRAFELPAVTEDLLEMLSKELKESIKVEFGVVSKVRCTVETSLYERWRY